MQVEPVAPRLPIECGVALPHQECYRVRRLPHDKCYRLVRLRPFCLHHLGGSHGCQYALSALKMNRLLDRFDEWAREVPDLDVAPVERFEPTRAPASPRLRLDLESGEIRSIVWATGFRPDYRWLDLPVLDWKGRLRHDGGVVADAPRLYAIGLPVLRRRKSTFIHGAEDDARDIVEHLTRSL